MSKTAAIPMDKEIQSFLFTFTGQQYFKIMRHTPEGVSSEMITSQISA